MPKSAQSSKSSKAAFQSTQAVDSKCRRLFCGTRHAPEQYSCAAADMALGFTDMPCNALHRGVAIPLCYPGRHRGYLRCKGMVRLDRSCDTRIWGSHCAHWQAERKHGAAMFAMSVIAACGAPLALHRRNCRRKNRSYYLTLQDGGRAVGCTKRRTNICRVILPAIY